MPTDPRQLHQQTAAALQRGDLAQAATLLEKAPKNLNFDFLRGTLALLQREWDKASEIFSILWQQHPEWHEAAYSLIQADIERGRLADAAAMAQSLLAQVPSPIPALLLARAAEAMGDQAVTNKALAEALQRGARDDTIISNLWLGRRKLWDWAEPLPVFTENDLTPAAATVLSDDPAFQKRVAERWCRQHFPQVLPALTRKPGDRIKIGYLSSDIHHHATAYLIAELFELHDRARFEVSCFSASHDDGSAIRRRIVDACKNFVDLSTMPPADWATVIRGAELDIAIDLKGHTRHNFLPVLAQRVAPVQVHFLGHPGTIGAPFIDYLVGDPVVTPASSEAHYSEKLIRLPHCYQINDRQRKLAPAQPRSAYGLPDDKVVLACFNQSYKLTPEVFAIWAEILLARPQSILWLYCNVPGAEDNLRAHLRQQGLSDERLVIAGPLPNDQHLARWQAADIALDTYAYTSHTTGSDALWAGVPLVTRIGQTYASRVAASLLTSTSLPDLITDNDDDYKKLILKLIDDAPRRKALREHLIASRTTAPLWNTEQWVRDWEAELGKIISDTRS